MNKKILLRAILSLFMISSVQNNCGNQRAPIAQARPMPVAQGAWAIPVAQAKPMPVAQARPVPVAQGTWATAPVAQGAWANNQGQLPVAQARPVPVIPKTNNKKIRKLNPATQARHTKPKRTSTAQETYVTPKPMLQLEDRKAPEAKEANNQQPTSPSELTFEKPTLPSWEDMLAEAQEIEQEDSEDEDFSEPSFERPTLPSWDDMLAEGEQIEQENFENEESSESSFERPTLPNWEDMLAEGEQIEQEDPMPSWDDLVAEEDAEDALLPPPPPAATEAIHKSISGRDDFLAEIQRGKKLKKTKSKKKTTKKQTGIEAALAGRRNAISSDDDDDYEDNDIFDDEEAFNDEEMQPNTASLVDLKFNTNANGIYVLTLTKEEKEAVMSGSNFRINEGKIVNLKDLNKASSIEPVNLNSENDGSLIISLEELELIINKGASIILDGKPVNSGLPKTQSNIIPPAPPMPPASAKATSKSSDRGNLLASIRKGTTLKKMSKRKNTKTTPKKQSTNQAMENIREAMMADQNNDDDDENWDDDDGDDW